MASKDYFLITRINKENKREETVCTENRSSKGAGRAKDPQGLARRGISWGQEGTRRAKEQDQLMRLTLPEAVRGL